MTPLLLSSLRLNLGILPGVNKKKTRQGAPCRVVEVGETVNYALGVSAVSAGSSGFLM